jgi:hypothetical protein
MGVGFGLVVLLAFAFHAPNEAIGVGGFLVVIGIAFFINGLFEPDRPAAEQTGRTAGVAAPPVSSDLPRHE